MHDFASGRAALSTRNFGTTYDCVCSYLLRPGFLNYAHVFLYVRDIEVFYWIVHSRPRFLWGWGEKTAKPRGCYFSQRFFAAKTASKEQ